MLSYNSALVFYLQGKAGRYILVYLCKKQFSLIGTELSI